MVNAVLLSAVGVLDPPSSNPGNLPESCSRPLGWIIEAVFGGTRIVLTVICLILANRKRETNNSGRT